MSKFMMLVLLAVFALLGSVGFTGGDSSGPDGAWPRDGKAQAGFDLGAISELGGSTAGDGQTDAAADAGPEPAAAVPCTAGLAGPYPCENVDLLGHVPLAQLGGAPGTDVWGWTDPATGREIAIMGTGLGTAFVDVTDPRVPVVIGLLPTETTDRGVRWRDIKVDQDHAFIVSENGEFAANGMQVFDLTRLRDAGPYEVLEPDATYGEFRNAHNVVINTETHFAYAVGTDTCLGGLHIIDLADPKQPRFAGCYDYYGYVHDAQCVVYRGPDPDYNGTRDGKPHELCFAAMEDEFAIIDVTDKSDIHLINWGRYWTGAYVHQGWLTPDHRWFVMNDEMDEGNTVANTTTYIFDLKDLDGNFDYHGDNLSAYTHPTEAIDHNLYIHGDRIYQANYTAGLRVLRYTNETLASGDLDQVAYFDVHPAHDAREYLGAWSVYPFFTSGTIVVSTIDQGLFLLDVTLPEGTATARAPGTRTR